MFSLLISEKGGDQKKMDFDKAEVTIGRVQGNDIVLPKGNVSKRHSRIVVKDGRFVVVDMKSTNGTYVNGRKITSPIVIKAGDKVYIGDFIISLDEVDEASLSDLGGAELSQPPAPPSQGVGGPPPLRPSTPGMMDAMPPRLSQPGPAPVAPPPLPPIAPPMSPPVAPPIPQVEQAPVPSNAFGLDLDPVEDAAPPSFRPAASMTPSFAPQPYAAPEPPQYPPQSAASALTPPAVPIPPVAPATPPSFPPQVAMAPPVAPVAPPSFPPPASMAPPIAPAAPPSVPPQAAVVQPLAPPTFSQAPAMPAAPPAPPSFSPAPIAPPASFPQAPMAAPTITATAAPAAPPAPSAGAQSAERGATSGARARGAALRAIMARVSSSFDIRDATSAGLSDSTRWQQADRHVSTAIQALSAEGVIDPGINKESLAGLAVQEAVGLGALDALMGDTGNEEIIVESPTRILVDSGRGLEPSLYLFSSPEAVAIIAERIVGPQPASRLPVRSVMLGNEWVARVLDAPLTTRGPMLVLRRIGHRGATGQELVEQGLIGQGQLDALRGAIAQGRNVLVSGPFDAGVTSTLSALATLGDANERVVAVEGAPSLAGVVPGIVGVSYGNGVSLSDALRHAQLLRPGRLLVDDLAGAGALDVLTTFASRKRACFAGMHADSPDAALRQLEFFATLDGRATREAAYALVREAFSVLVQLGTDASGRRVVTQIIDVR
jgi:pilus assembly protein CpaF